MNSSRIIFRTVTIVAAICSGTAYADSPRTGNLQIKIEITKDCQVNTDAKNSAINDAVLDFGSHGVLNSDIDAQTAGAGSIRVQCTSGVDYNIGLDGGGTKDTSNRRMKSTDAANTETIGYQLYSDKSGGKVWGNTAGTDTVKGKADGTLQSYTVYGRVIAQSTPPAGIYSDTVAVTVTF
ncbi:hypothetical protein A6U86_18425 [Rhizobium sp. AC27/96]|nr:hypothetical protein A6U86_18425 [Rhizobium sp. AC27/96]